MNVSNTTLNVVSSGKMTIDQKDKTLRDLFEKSVDTTWISRFVIGVYWRDASDEQKSKYTEFYHKFLMDSYVPKFRSYTDQKFELKSVEALENDEYLVQTEIYTHDKPSLRVDYKIRKGSDGKYKIFDVIAEGVSLITTQRSEFGSIVSRNGIDYLIDKLKARSEEDKKAS